MGAGTANQVVWCLGPATRAVTLCLLVVKFSVVPCEVAMCSSNGEVPVKDGSGEVEFLEGFDLV